LHLKVFCDLVHEASRDKGIETGKDDGKLTDTPGHFEFFGVTDDRVRLRWGKDTAGSQC
jgi:hypothetical protein